VRAI